MKKMKVKLNYDELNAICQRISLVCSQGKFKTFETKMIASLLLAFTMKQQSKLFFQYVKPATITFDVPTACAFVIFCGWQQLDARSFEENVMIRVNNKLQQQLA